MGFRVFGLLRFYGLGLGFAVFGVSGFRVWGLRFSGGFLGFRVWSFLPHGTILHANQLQKHGH